MNGIKLVKADLFWIVTAAICLAVGEPQSFIFYCGVLIGVMAALFLLIQGLTSSVNAVMPKIAKKMPEEDLASYRAYMRSKGNEPRW